MSEESYNIKGSWRGKLTIVPRPRGGDWLEDDVRSWGRSGLEVIVSFLSPDETAELGLSEEAEFCQSSGIKFLSFPIPDRGVPTSREDTLRLVKELERYLTTGNRVGIHCRQGIGRSGLVAACLLVSSGLTPERAFGQISAARGLPVPETPEQHKWVEAFAPQLASDVARQRP